MNFFLYFIIFIIGTFFGSFFTLAVYRIPKNEDILIKHSYCPNCNHKLGFFDLFPVLSYIFLKGKCSYCGNKIRIRYLILELLSGFTFLILVISMNINVYNPKNIINIAFLLIYVSVLFIIAGIDKENKNIEMGVLGFGITVDILYMIYQYTLGRFNVYQYVIYIVLFIILLVILKVKKNEKYLIQNLLLALYMMIFSGFKIYAITLLVGMPIILINKKKTSKIPTGFYISISNIIVIILSNIVTNFI